MTFSFLGLYLWLLDVNGYAFSQIPLMPLIAENVPSFPNVCLSSEIPNSFLPKFYSCTSIPTSPSISGTSLISKNPFPDFI